MLDAFGLFPLEQPLRTTEPARGRAHLAAESEVHPDPEGAADRALLLASLGVAVVRTLQQRQPFIDATEHVRRHREQLEVAATERSGLVGACETLVGLPPRQGVVGLAALFQVAGCLHQRATAARLCGLPHG